MIPLPELGFTVSGSYPASGSRRAGYFNFRVGMEFAVSVEGPQGLPASLGRNNGDWELALKQDLGQDWDASFNALSLMSLDLDSVRSARGLGTAIAKALTISRKLGNWSFELSIEESAPYCIFKISYQFTNLQYPESGYWRFPNSDVDCRIKLTGTLSVRFGPNEQGWRYIGQRAARLVRPIVAQLQAAGARAAAGSALRSSGYVVAGIAGGLAVATLSAHIVQRARQEGITWGLANQYAAGYVGVLWVRTGTAFAESDFERAMGPTTITGQSLQARMAGVNHALNDIEANGGGLSGIRAVRREIFSILGLDMRISRDNPSEDWREAAVMALTEYLRGNNRRPPVRTPANANRRQNRQLQP